MYQKIYLEKYQLQNMYLNPLKNAFKCVFS